MTNDSLTTAVDPNQPAPPSDPQALQIALLERMVEQQAALLVAAQAQTRLMSQNGALSVKVADFKMPFGSMVNLFVMAVLAAIPAAIFVGLLWFIVFMFFGGILRAFLG